MAAGAQLAGGVPDCVSPAIMPFPVARVDTCLSAKDVAFSIVQIVLSVWMRAVTVVYAIIVHLNIKHSQARAVKKH